MKDKVIYFPNLNGLRFIAAALVFIHHVDQFRYLFGLPNNFAVPVIFAIGKLGVILFFVLSGFLITYILLAEESLKGKINIPRFYMRRVLRIWPLYFLVLILALLVLPNFSFFIVPGYEKEVLYQHFTIKAALYFTFFANLAVSMYNIFPYASQTWSIGTEEQFYLIWPLLVSFFKKNRMVLMIAVVIVYLCAQLLLNSDVQFIPGKMYLRKFWKLFNIDCMAIGGFFAVVLYTGKFRRYLLNNTIFYVSLIAATLLILFPINLAFGNYEVYAVLFGVIILNFAANTEIAISLENKWMNYLGKISYGLYMYHILAIVICMKLLLMAGWQNSGVIYPVAFGLTVLIAVVSYEYFEKYFISRKKKYSELLSGDQVKDDKVVTVPVSIVHSHLENRYSSHPGYTAEPLRSPAPEDSGTGGENVV